MNTLTANMHARTIDPRSPKRMPSVSSYDLHGETRVRLPSDRIMARRDQTLTRGEWLAAQEP